MHYYELQIVFSLFSRVEHLDQTFLLMGDYVLESPYWKPVFCENQQRALLTVFLWKAWALC